MDGGSPNQVSTRELKVLKTLIEAGCSSTPKLLAFKWATQDRDTMPVPGGYMLFVGPPLEGSFFGDILIRD